jgi:hypothetical protein
MSDWNMLLIQGALNWIGTNAGIQLLSIALVLLDMSIESSSFAFLL